MVRSKAVTGIIGAIFALLLHVWPGMVVSTHAQGSRKDDVVFNSRGVPMAGAKVRVCAMPATGQPCAPLALIYSDPGLTQALANPISSDGMGSYSFYATPGKYELEISGPGITTKQIPNVILPSDPSAPTFNSLSTTEAISAFSLNLAGDLTVHGNSAVTGSLASGTLNLASQGTPPGAASAGTINLYTKSADKRLYYKDETGTEIGPIASGSGAQTNLPNTFTAPQNVDADFHTKGPNPAYDLSRFGAYIGPNYNTPTTGSISSGSQTLTIANAMDFANGQGVVVLGAGPATSLATPTGVTASAQGVTGATTYYYAVVDEDYANGRTAVSGSGNASNAVATLGIQTVTGIVCNRVSGIVTCTTPSAHNFISGSQVELPRGSAGDGSFEGAFTITSVPNSTTFTFTQFGALDRSGVVTDGTARVVGRVMVRWNITTTAVMKHLIYRCPGTSSCTLPANAGNYTLVGVSIGLDSSFVDYGYTLNTSSVDNGDAPATARTSPSKQWLATTITAGGGTTTLTLANAAASTVSGVKVAHDNTPVLLNACAAIGATHQGGVILVPSLGSTSGTNFFPISSTLNGCGGVEIDFASPVWANAPIVPGGGAKFKGISGGNTGQMPPFYNVSQTVLVNGMAYPFFLMALPNSRNLSLEGFLMQCYQPYQSCVVQDEVSDSSAVYSIRYKDVHLQGYASTIPYIARGGFGFFWDGGGWSNQPNDFSALPAVLFTNNCGLGTSSNELPSIIYTEKTYLFGLMLVDSCGVGNLQQGWNHNEFRELLTENDYGPAVRINAGGTLWADDFVDTTYADYRGGAATPLFDFTNAQTAGVRLVHPFCATGLQPAMQTSTGVYHGIEINNTSGGCALFGTNYGVLRDGNSNIDTYWNSQIAFAGAGGKAYYSMSLPAAPQSAVVSAGGNVPVGGHTYQATAVDFDGGETMLSTPISATTSSGNQTITVTMPATLPLGASGFNLYRDGSLVAANSCFYPQFATVGAVWVDIYGYTCGVSAPNYSSAGQVVLSANGVTAPKMRVAGEVMSGAPRGEQNIFLPGALSSTWTASTWTPDKAVTVTRMQVQAKTAPGGCTTNAVVRLTDGSAPINLTIAAAANDSGAVAQNYAAGTPLTISVQTAAAGCSTVPADANVTIQYRMQ